MRLGESMVFPVSGVETSPFIPPLVAMIISFFTSMGGVSGAFLLLPFQISVLGFAGPGVTPTNLIFNVVGIPSAIYRYTGEGRMVWPLAINIICGTLPGLLVGVVVRIVYLPDPRDFKLFVGCVLFYIGARLMYQVLAGNRPGDRAANAAEQKMMVRNARHGGDAPRPVKMISFSLLKTEYEFYGERFRFSTVSVFMLSLVVGLVGGIYGIGGGAIIAPFLVTIFRLPVHTVAGATLMGTCVTSVLGIVFYTLMAPSIAPADMVVSPDWLLGLLFGIGGLVGMYLGASCQRYVPATIIRPCLGLLITGLALRYIVGYFL